MRTFQQIPSWARRGVPHEWECVRNPAGCAAPPGVYPSARGSLGEIQLEGLLQGWLTSHVWGCPTGEDACHAQEVPTGVQG